jgi:hypothetical protein
MKTYYKYDTREYRLLTRAQLILAVAAIIGGLVFGISCFLAPGRLMMNLAFFVICVLVVLLTLPSRKKHMFRIQNENLIAHDWGIEHQIGDIIREVKWEQISGVDTIDHSFVLYKMKEYVISVAGDAPLVFYSSLENADFLVNYIRKNLKKRSEDVQIAWVKDKDKDKGSGGATYEDMTDL